MREAWSEKKEKKERKKERRTKKDKRKQAEWNKTQADGGEELGPVAAFRLAKKKLEDEGAAEIDADYKAFKREVRDERVAKRSRKEEKESGRLDGGMFGDME